MDWPLTYEAAAGPPFLALNKASQALLTDDWPATEQMTLFISFVIFA